MRISVRVKANSKKPGIDETDPGQYIVRVAAPAVDGKANAAVVKALAVHFSIRQSQVQLVRGEKSREKVFNIDIEVTSESYSNRKEE